jgi:predicted dehydrogenase
MGKMDEGRKEVLDVAVVGLGKMGLLHSCILNVLPNVRLCAVCDKSNLIRKIGKKVFKYARLLDDVEKLADLKVDAVYVTTPIPSHFFIAKTLHSKGIVRNMFVEKTLASNYDQSKEMCSLGEGSGGVNMVGYMKRFGVTYGKARGLLEEQALGRVDSFDAYAYSSDFAEVKQGSSVAGARGGVLEDLGSHVVDVALWFFGDLRVESSAFKSTVAPGSEDSVSVGVKGIDGLSGRFDVSWCRKEYRMPEFGLTVRGSKGVLRVNDDALDLDLGKGNLKKWYRHDLNDNVGFLLGAPEYFREDETFVRSILEGRVVEPTFITASRVDYLIEQARTRAGRK